MIEPYYEHNGITIYHGDCLDILPHLPKVDLVLTDPPYNGDIKYGLNTNDSKTWNEYCNWLIIRIEQAEQISNGPVITFISKPGMIEMIKRKTPWWIGIWSGCGANPAGPNNGVMFNPGYEPCLFYGNRYGLKACIPDIWKTPPERRKFNHPCPKPIKLLNDIISGLKPTIILDPFMGSGTTLRAAKDLNRKAIGIEICEAYCEVAAKRLSQEVFNFT
jgi:site-specific DNA-methyltransferase (adenine-specific)